MSRTIGQHTVGELFLMVEDLEHRVDELRREQLPSLLSEVTRLATLVSRELETDRKALVEAEAKFNREFGLMNRLNPFGRKARESAWRRTVGRHQREVHGDKQLHDRLYELLTLVNGAAQPIEWREHAGPIAAVFNESTGRVEWRQDDIGGLAGVYNPINRDVEWRRADGAVYGVFNPRLNVVEWRESKKGGVCGVFNPVTGDVEWREEAGAGVFGVFIADSQTVRWRSIPRTSVAAGWDRTKLRWEWRDSKVGGLACVYHDGVAYRTSCGWCPTL